MKNITLFSVKATGWDIWARCASTTWCHSRPPRSFPPQLPQVDTYHLKCGKTAKNISKWTHLPSQLPQVNTFIISIAKKKTIKTCIFVHEYIYYLNCWKGRNITIYTLLLFLCNQIFQRWRPTTSQTCKGVNGAGGALEVVKDFLRRFLWK